LQNVGDNDSVTGELFTQPECGSPVTPGINLDTSARNSENCLPKRQKKNIDAKKMEFIDLASEAMKSINMPNKDDDDECSIVGKRFAFQLRDMKDDQRFLAEKNCF